jgi:DNA adenine methylase
MPPATAFQIKIPTRPSVIATPFLKWVGGKRRVLPEIFKDMPEMFDHYYEPFLGGGALFFHMRSHGLLMDNQVTISDANLRLIRTYKAVRDDVEGLIERLTVYKERHGKEFYYDLRAVDIDRKRSDTDVAAWMIYLNKTGFNGLYRVNKRNKFNTPFGRYKNPKVCDIPNLRACSHALQGIEIKHAYFDHMRDRIKKNDFVYFDPPYVPVSVTSSFTAYTNNGFGSLEQTILCDFAQEIKKKDAFVTLSNSDHPFVRKLYKGFRVRSIQVGRSINSKSSARGKVGELIIS